MKFRKIFTLPFVALGSIALATTLQAQTTGETEGAANVTPRVVCMSRAYSNVAQVRQEQRGRPFYIAVSARSARGLGKRGFAEVDCTEAGFENPRDFVRYRNRMCRLAATGNEAVQNQFQRAIGARPAVLCANAERLAGRWDRIRDAGDLGE